eukprot:1192523-Prorocentrum_minimum.AAC.1
MVGRLGKRASKRLKKELEEEIDEYYKLDFEDMVAGLKCRFAYTTVPPPRANMLCSPPAIGSRIRNMLSSPMNRLSSPLRLDPTSGICSLPPCDWLPHQEYESAFFPRVTPRKYGIKTEEILSQSDKELNQLVGLKKLAPFRDESRDKWQYTKSAMQAQRAVSRAPRGHQALVKPLRHQRIQLPPQKIADALTLFNRSNREEEAKAERKAGSIEKAKGEKKRKQAGLDEQNVRG